MNIVPSQNLTDQLDNMNVVQTETSGVMGKTETSGLMGNTVSK